MLRVVEGVFIGSLLVGFHAVYVELACPESKMVWIAIVMIKISIGPLQ